MAAANKMLFEDHSGTTNALMAAASARNTMNSLMAQAASAQFKSDHHLGHLPTAAGFAPYHPAHYVDAGAALAAVNLHTGGGHVGPAGLYHSRDQATFSHAWNFKKKKGKSQNLFSIHVCLFYFKITLYVCVS